MNRAEFYQRIRTGIGRYLPMGYQKYQVHIKETEVGDRKHALLKLEKEGIHTMPTMSLESYLSRRESGMDENSVLIEIAVDYAKLVSMQRKKQHRQMVR